VARTIMTGFWHVPPTCIYYVHSPLSPASLREKTSTKMMIVLIPMTRVYNDSVI